MIRHETESQRSAEGTAHSSNQRSYNAVLAIHLLGRGGRPDVFGNASYSWAEFNGQPCPSILSVLSWPIILKSILSQVHFSGHVLFSTAIDQSFFNNTLVLLSHADTRNASVL